MKLTACKGGRAKEREREGGDNERDRDTKDKETVDREAGSPICKETGVRRDRG